MKIVKNRSLEALKAFHIRSIIIVQENNCFPGYYDFVLWNRFDLMMCFNFFRNHLKLNLTLEFEYHIYVFWELNWNLMDQVEVVVVLIHLQRRKNLGNSRLAPTVTTELLGLLHQVFMKQRILRKPLLVFFLEVIFLFLRD